MTSVCPVALIVLLLCCGGVASARGSTGRRVRRNREETTGHLADATDPMLHVVGAKFIVLGESSEGEGQVFLGPGLIYELMVLPHWLEVELAAAVLFTREQLKIPLDIILKIPFYISRAVDLFAGLGPMLSISVHESQTHVHPGIIGSVGAMFWPWPQIGFLLELDYAFVAEGSGAHEVEGACGLAFRFR